IENPGLDPQMYGQLIFDKAGKSIQWKNDSLFSKLCWENWTKTCRRMNLDHFLISYTKINSKWMQNLNMRQESIRILGGETGSNLGSSNFLLDVSLQARETNAKMNYWDL
ncbi:LIN1 transcriptase, partial [Crocuta crocuta]